MEPLDVTLGRIRWLFRPWARGRIAGRLRPFGYATDATGVRADPGHIPRALSGPAFIELRQRINAAMDRRIPVIYGTTLVTSLLLLAVSWRAGSATVLVTTSVALLCLVADAALMVRKNVPINCPAASGRAAPETRDSS